MEWIVQKSVKFLCMFFFNCNGVHGKDNNTSVVIVCTHGMSACYGESCAEVDWA